jgi:hypothetical protein
MNIIKPLKDKVHSIIAKFVPACLPGAKKKYNAKVVHKTVLDIEDVAGKAKAYNIDVPPSKIIEGFNTAVNLIFYLISDGYSFECELFSIGLGIPGEYSGTEEHLPAGVHPHVRIRASKPLNEYITKNVTVVLDGIDEEDGAIDTIKDEESATDDPTITRGYVVTLTGKGLKIAHDDEHLTQTGAFFANAGGEETPAKAIAYNTARKVKLIVPDTLTPETLYAIILRTQSSVKSSGAIVKAVREVRTDCSLKAK